MNCQFHHHRGESATNLARRWFLRDCGVGLATMSLAQLFGNSSCGAAESGDVKKADPLAPKVPHFTAKAKRVIYLFMAGAPSHLELFDYKPQLAKFDGTLPPAELLKGYRAAFINPNSKLLGPKFKFAKHGQCGAELSELLPHLAEVVDDIDDRQVDDDRCVQSCPGANSDEHRLAAVRPAELRRVDAVRPGQRVAKPARLRRAAIGQERPQRRQLELGQRLFADRVSGRAVSRPAAIQCCIFRIRTGSMRSCSATRSIRSSG